MIIQFVPHKEGNLYPPERQTSQGVGPGSILGQTTWDLWWT
jgi:hypothetical protein